MHSYGNCFKSKIKLHFNHSINCLILHYLLINCMDENTQSILDKCGTANVSYMIKYSESLQPTFPCLAVHQGYMFGQAISS